jgi:RNA polymerase sigma-70 factor (ECF subfamily)
MGQQHSGDAHFQTTSWSLILAASDRPTPSSEAALAEFCQLYWYPVYAFIRRQGNAAEDARDLAQEFFVRILERNYLRDADPSRGRFRSFLLASARHFLANQRHRANSLKRGGGVQQLSLDWKSAEGRYSNEPGDAQTPENLYEKNWAITLVDHTLDLLRQDYASAGKLDLFNSIAPVIGGGVDESYGEIARRLNTTEGAIKVAVFRARKRYGNLLRQSIAETVADADEIEDEIAFLLSVLERSW